VAFAKVVAKIFLSRRTAILSKVKSYIWNNAPYREKLNAGKIRFSLSLYFKVPLFCDCGISACRIFAFPPAAADCEMKFYIKLRVFLSLSHSYFACASESPLPFPFSLVPSLLLPRSSSPFVYLRTDRSLYWRLHIYWRCCLSRDETHDISGVTWNAYLPSCVFAIIRIFIIATA